VYWNWIAAVTVVTIFAYLAYLLLAARSVLDRAPHEDMFICDVHGPMPRSTLIRINQEGFELEMNGHATRGEVDYCPLCFRDRIRTAKEKMREKA
jgi:hypothetical protein